MKRVVLVCVLRMGVVVALSVLVATLSNAAVVGPVFSEPEVGTCAVATPETQVAGLDCPICIAVCLLDPSGVACGACLAICTATPI